VSDPPAPDSEGSYRAFLASAEENASRDYDRTLTTLAGGALVLSIAFVHDIAPHPQYNFWLVISWVAFTASLLAILVSFLTSLRSLRWMMNEIDEGRSPTRALSSRLTVFLNRAAAALLLLGVVALTIFAALNLREEQPNAGKTPTKTRTPANSTTVRTGQTGIRPHTTTSSSAPARP
jgi:hypothetical protein